MSTNGGRFSSCTAPLPQHAVLPAREIAMGGSKEAGTMSKTGLRATKAVKRVR